jgi:lipopolysaccharide biosynthesis glycosyltransferase
MSSDLVRVFVGTDRSQALAVKVLRHSIIRHTKLKVEVTAMQDLPVPVPSDPRNGQRTGFSFSRFCIPRLAGYRGKAVYMDADMLVFRDIKELWELPFNKSKVVIQNDITNQDGSRKFGAPAKRIKQCAVMLLDCDGLDWNIENIIRDMNLGNFDYEKLMYDLCILAEGDISYTLPFAWNSLEHFDSETRLIHYTDMASQPWVSTSNKFGQLWFDEVRLMLSNGQLSWQEVEQEIALGYFRPSLIRDLKFRHLVPKLFRKAFDLKSASLDLVAGFKAHREVYAAKKRRDQAVKEWVISQKSASESN